MVSIMLFVILFIAMFSGIISFCLYSTEPKNAKIAGLICIITTAMIIICPLNRPSPMEVVEEKVFLINNKAISESCLNLNEELGINLKEGDVIYRIKRLPYWHRGLYWFKDQTKKYEFSLKDPRK